MNIQVITACFYWFFITCSRQGKNRGLFMSKKNLPNEFFCPSMVKCAVFFDMVINLLLEPIKCLLIIRYQTSASFIKRKHVELLSYTVKLSDLWFSPDFSLKRSLFYFHHRFGRNAHTKKVFSGNSICKLILFTFYLFCLFNVKSFHSKTNKKPRVSSAPEQSLVFSCS